MTVRRWKRRKGQRLRLGRALRATRDHQMMLVANGGEQCRPAVLHMTITGKTTKEYTDA